MEKYSNKYPEFRDWTWEVYHGAKNQITETGLELLVRALGRGINQTPLPDSAPSEFYESYFDMIETHNNDS
ncbi:hypothetical protein QQS21_012502 [Conoideocrella luteorostrata]|uniref:Uncharacterized protein n=1 Tax=Conoideocrella luteorostrata TaxID=1105319 RepID=A0AAJ0CDS8_9HYPO|nr:hypothetical protein QQS21_012502 [Conoideocrella luteorostrata]